MSRRTRVEAARLAAKAVQGQCAEGDVGARVLALCTLFENYIDLGVDRTDRLMRLFPPDVEAKVVLLKGGKSWPSLVARSSLVSAPSSSRRPSSAPPGC